MGLASPRREAEQGGRRGDPGKFERVPGSFPSHSQEETPMPNPEPTIRSIPLSRLELAPENVRKTPPDPAFFAELKASIAAHDLLENLLVRVEHPGGNGIERCAVVAGGRRLAAMQALAEEGALDADHPVPCRVIGAEENAGELSLAENVVRVAMHPADQVVAFTRLSRSGVSVSAISARFGVTERLVEQRLSLGDAAPELLDAYRAEEMDLDTLKAFTVTTDHARQIAVWEQVKEYGYGPSGWQVRRMLTEENVSAVSAVARFVGMEAYEAAGGTFTRDLFAEEDARGIWFDDPALLNELASEKLRAAADELKTHWKWAEAVVEADWSAIAGFGRISPEPGTPTEEEKAERERLLARHDELVNTDEADWTDELGQEAEALEARLRAVDEAVSARAAFRPGDYELAGCIATVGHDGALKVVEGLVRPEDMPERTDAGEANGADPGRVDAPLATPADPRAKVRKETGIGIGLADDQRAVRTTIVKAYLSGDFEAAFDLTLFQYACAAFADNHMAGCLDIAFRETADRPPARGRTTRISPPGAPARPCWRNVRTSPWAGWRTRTKTPPSRDAGAARSEEKGPVRGGGRALAQGTARLRAGRPSRIRGHGRQARHRLRETRAPVGGYVLVAHHEGPHPRHSARDAGSCLGLRPGEVQEGGTWPRRWKRPSPPTRPRA